MNRQSRKLTSIVVAMLMLGAALSQAQCVSPEWATLAAQEALAGAQFGYSVAVHGNTAVVGAREEGSGQGCAYVFEFDGVAMQQVARLTASDGAMGDKLGTSVGVYEGTVVIGAPQPFPVEQPGRVYVFEKPTGGWADMTETAVLTAGDGAPNDNFGAALDLDRESVVIGAYLADGASDNSGAAYVFDQPSGGWASVTETAKLTAGDAALNDQFGISVAVAGDIIAVGADRDSDNAYQAGAAYVFEKPSGGWADALETAKLTANDPVDLDRFGLSVGVGEGFVVAGAWGDDRFAEKAGVVHVFERPTGGWADMAATAELSTGDAAAGDHLGWTVDADGDVILAGAPANLFDGSGFGAAYLYLKPAGGWTDAVENAQLASYGMVADDEFGTAVALGGPVAMVGARYVASDGYSNAGASYIFGGAVDCNANAALDLCEILDGSGVDANGNGILDECEGVVDAPLAPASLMLTQNHPNPFNPSTEIRYSVSTAGSGSLRIFDLQGRIVRTLVHGDFSRGEGAVTWHGRDDSGRSVGSGVYVYRLTVSGQSQERRMVLLK